MKKIVLALVFILSLCKTAFAMEVYLPVEGIDTSKTKARDENGNTISTIIFNTRMEYLQIDFSDWGNSEGGVWIRKSADLENWELCKFIPNEVRWESSMKAFPGTVDTSTRQQIINTGKEYLVRSVELENNLPANNYVAPYSKRINVYDLDFNYVKTIEFDPYIVKMSYINETYYATSANSKTYKSEDLETWEVAYDGIGVPISNGEHTIFTTHIKDESADLGDLLFYQSPILYKNGNVDKNVAVENIELRTTTVYRDFFVTYNNYLDETGTKMLKQISFSKDGVYWATAPIESRHKIDWLEEDKDGIVTSSRLKIKFSDMEAVVPRSSTYVEVNNEILGFDTPPTMEDDRLLVPMRFLFEKLGAEVEWNNGTQTATVQKNTPDTVGAVEKAETISFKINETTAKIGNTTATMDVPARLINNRTMVPLRFLSENLGYNVEWNQETNTAIITQ